MGVNLGVSLDRSFNIRQLLVVFATNKLEALSSLPLSEQLIIRFPRNRFAFQ